MRSWNIAKLKYKVSEWCRSQFTNEELKLRKCITWIIPSGSSQFTNEELKLAFVDFEKRSVSGSQFTNEELKQKKVNERKID